MSSWPRTVVPLFVALFAGCGEAEVQPIALEPEGAPVEPPAPVHASVAPDPTMPPPAPEPPPDAEPAPDPEALARARADAAREAFERAYPWQGVAYHFLAQVRKRPDGSSPVIGYMRRGSQFRAKPTLRGPGCRRGWAEVPGGGYVCRGEGFSLGERPQSFDPSPVSAAIDNALPYAYGWIARDDTPQYWHLPSAEEERIAREWIARRSEAEEDAERAAEAEPEPVAPAEAEDEAESTVEPDLEAPPGLAEAEGVSGEEPAEASEAGSEAVVPPEEEPDEQPSFLRMRMRRGFYVSIDRLETNDQGRFYRTVRGAYVPADAVAEASPPEMRGVVLGGRWRLPVGFVYRGGVRSLTRDSASGRLRMAAPIDRFTPMPLAEEVITRRRRRYRTGDRGRIVREDALRIASAIERPEGIGPDERWIHVDLGEQVLVAYEGDRPVFATMVSTGRAGFETPTGTFRIQSKHVSTTMDDTDAGAEAYSIEDVPWTMYFEGSYALHAAFWHNGFGRVRSHGCVNLAPADARWVFFWTLPELPEAFHGISAARDRPGTRVHVTE